MNAIPLSDNMRLWDAVCRTDPANTKRVQQRGGFTAISAHSQIMEATRQFGPVGQGWGYECAEIIRLDSMVVVPVTLWHGDRANRFGPIYGCAEMFGNRPDHDAPKKAMTDAITKGLSQLGFNADVFLGLYDDNKYVEQMRREFAGGPPADNDAKPNGRDAPFPQGPAKNKTELKAIGRDFWRDVEACDDFDQLTALLATNTELQRQICAALPLWWEGGEKNGEPYEGLAQVINRQLDALDPNRGQANRTPITAAG